MVTLTLHWGADPDHAAGSAAGVATVSGVGLSAFFAAGASAGIAAAAAVGVASFLAAGSAAGVATAAAVGTDGSSNIPAVIYDGVQGYMLHTGGPTGAADGATLSFAWAGTFNSDGSAMTLLDIPGTVPVKITRQSDNTIDFVGGTAGAVFSNSTTAVAASLGFLIILASCNGTSSTLKVVHATATITGTNTPGTATNLDLTADWFLGSDGGAAEFLDADTALWWIHSTVIDFTDADNIEQFWDTTLDKLRDPGATGTNPTDGTQPLVCHKNPAATHTVNVGSGGDADTAGTFTDGTSPGTYAADFVPVTFPQTSAPVETSSAVDGGAFLVTMPATVNAGDLLLAFVAFWAANPPTITTPTGWDLIATNTGDAGAAGNRTAVFARDADGTEGGTTVDFATDNPIGGRAAAAQVYRVTDWFGTVTGGVEGSLAAGANTQTPDPAALTPSWGSANNLWFVVVGAVDDAATVSVYPTNYLNGVDTTAGTTNAGVLIATARRELTATSDDPGAFTLSEADVSVPGLVAVRSA